MVDSYEELLCEKEDQLKEMEKKHGKTKKEYKGIVEGVDDEVNCLKDEFCGLENVLERLRAQLDTKKSIVLTTAQGKAEEILEVSKEFKQLELEIGDLRKALEKLGGEDGNMTNIRCVRDS